MTKKIQQAALTAFRLALKPLVRMLLRNGVTWKQAAEVCKRAYVEVAREDYGVHGRPTNASRVAILTGLSRQEVKRVREALADQPEALERMSAATRLLGGWHTDPAFCDASGKPLALPMDADTTGVSFKALCARYAPDIPVTAMLKELQRVKVVNTAAGGLFEVKARYYMPDSQDPDAVLRAGTVLQDLGTTVAFNLQQNRAAGEATRFEGRATNARLKPAVAKKFRAYLEHEAQGFLERTDEWLAKHEKPDSSSKKERTVRLGVGVYQIDDDKK